MDQTPAIPTRFRFGHRDFREQVFNAIEEERRRHEKLDYDLNMSDLRFLRTHMEELGEAAKALDEDPAHVGEELVQLAASIVAHREMRMIRNGGVAEKGWENIEAHLVDCPVRGPGKTTNVCICLECDGCGGCGWTEGGVALKTTCSKCRGKGVVKS